MDNNIAIVDGKEVELNVPAMIVNDRTLVPVRFVSESTGADVEWVGAEKKAVIKTKPEAEPVATPTPVNEAKARYQQEKSDKATELSSKL